MATESTEHLKIGDRVTLDRYPDRPLRVTQVGRGWSGLGSYDVQVADVGEPRTPFLVGWEDESHHRRIA